MHGCHAVVDNDLGFGRGTEKLIISIIKEKEIRRRIDAPQGAVYIKFISAKFLRKPSAQYNLKYITAHAGCDTFSYHFLVIIIRSIWLHRPCSSEWIYRYIFAPYQRFH